MISKEERKRRNRRGGGVFLFFFLPGRIMSEESIFDLWFEGKPRVARDSQRGGRVSCALLGVIICKRRQKWIGKICSSRRLKNPPFANAFFLSIYLRMNLLQGCVSLVNFNNATVRTLEKLAIVHRVFVLSISIGSKKICIYLLNVTMIKLTLPIFCTHGSCTDFPRFFYSQSANLLGTGSILEEIHL